MEKTVLTASDLDARPVEMTEIELCERRAEIDWFPGDWQICRTDL